MTSSRDPDGSTRIGQDDRVPPTSTGSDVTGRMTGAHHTSLREHEAVLATAKTSAAATFGLVFGLASLFCALTAILAPAAVLFGLIGLVLGLVGVKKGKLPHVTGHKVAIGGVVTALLGLLLGAAVLAGAAAIVNNEGALNRISNQIDDLRGQLPSSSQVTGSFR